MLMGIANDDAHPGQGGEFFGSALGIASGDHDAGFGILPADAADGGAGVLIGAARDSAGIQNDHRSFARARRACESLVLELAFQSGSIGLCGATSEILYEETGHAL
jgi:hypothetical protein